MPARRGSMGRKKKLKMKVIMVRPGGLLPNPQHPHAHDSTSSHREAMLQVVARGLANLERNIGPTAPKP